MVGISGGVDSSVAALLLQRQGLRIAGLFMQNWDDDGSGDCRAEDDRRDAVASCGQLGIPFFARNFAREYWAGVFAQGFTIHGADRAGPGRDVLAEEVAEIAFADETDAGRILFRMHRKTGLARQLAHLRLGQFTDGKQRGGQRFLPERVQEIGLVLALVARAQQPVAAIALVDAGVVAGGDALRAECAGFVEEGAELDLAVAQH
ncbi:MAG: hypothetical protein GX826_08570, partial [Gammaproteobacteria bacterium]|nr:hypothetical protein [Gammaproteobacteria bacterium]